MTVQEILEKYDAIGKSEGESEAALFLERECQAYGEAAPEDLTGRAALYNELGGQYCAAGSYEKSERAFLRAVELLGGSEEYRRSDSRAAVLENLGSLYRLARQYDKALEQFNAVREIYDEAEVSGELYASCISNIGQVYLDAGQPEEAEEYFKGALTIAQTDGALDAPAPEQPESGDARDTAEYLSRTVAQLNALVTIGTSLGGMASARLMRGDTKGAAELLRQAGERFNSLGGQYAEAGEFFLTKAKELGGN